MQSEIIVVKPRTHLFTGLFFPIPPPTQSILTASAWRIKICTNQQHTPSPTCTKRNLGAASMLMKLLLWAPKQGSVSFPLLPNLGRERISTQKWQKCLDVVVVMWWFQKIGPRAKSVEWEVREPCDNACETAGKVLNIMCGRIVVSSRQDIREGKVKDRQKAICRN